MKFIIFVCIFLINYFTSQFFVSSYILKYMMHMSTIKKNRAVEIHFLVFIFFNIFSPRRVLHGKKKKTCSQKVKLLVYLKENDSRYLKKT